MILTRLSVDDLDPEAVKVLMPFRAFDDSDESEQNSETEPEVES